MKAKKELEQYAAQFAALGHEARLAIVRLLLSAHPQGMVVQEIQQELGMPASTLSHHLEALRKEGLIEQTREGKFLRYAASSSGLRELLDFLYQECCTRSELIPAGSLKRGPAPK